MSSAIPASCPSCGAVFPSRLANFGGANIKNLTLIGNKETCPYCGSMADVANGVFNITESIVTVVSAPNVTKEMLAKFSHAVQEAYRDKTAPEDLAREVEQIDPRFGEIIRDARKNPRLYTVALILILAAIKSCSVEVKVDANRLIDQIQGVAPSSMLSDQ